MLKSWHSRHTRKACGDLYLDDCITLCSCQRMTAIHHMQDECCTFHVVQGCLESCHQLWWKFLYEAHSVTDHCLHSRRKGVSWAICLKTEIVMPDMTVLDKDAQGEVQDLPEDLMEVTICAQLYQG